MNTDTGQITRFYDNASFDAAKAKDPKLVEVSVKVANAVEIGMLALNRAERRQRQFKKNTRR